jgi:hypothetical protein
MYMNDPFTSGFDVGFDFGTGMGIVNASAALEAVVPAAPVPVPVATVPMPAPIARVDFYVVCWAVYWVL